VHKKEVVEFGLYSLIHFSCGWQAY